MNNKRFLYLVLIAFIAGTAVLALIQYNSSANMDDLITGNDNLLRELKVGNQLRELERNIIWVESRIRAAIATDDTSHIQGVDHKMAEIHAYVDSLKQTNIDDSARRYIDRLAVLAEDKLKAKDQLMREFFRTGRMDDTSLIANPRAREISNEISNITRSIYDSRQTVMTSLSGSIKDSTRKARTWSLALAGLVVLIAAALLWFILRYVRKQQQLIAELDRSEKKVRETSRIKENFMTNMSHEIRTPLNSIIGFTHLLRHKQTDAESAEYVHSIQKAGETLLAIVNDILDLSKIEAGMVRIEANPFSVRGLQHSVQTLFGEKVKEKGLTLTTEIDPTIPDTLIGDATRLTQVLVNLIANALKFTEQGSIAIRIYPKASEAGMLQLGFSIRDTGIGIEQHKLAQIFDRFQQAEDSITRKYGGTGLGLSIVKDLVQLQGGDITVTSEVGKGTQFDFYIPYRIAPQQAPQPLKPVTKQDLPADHTANILVVDDNDMNRNLMKHLFSQWELPFHSAQSGQEAIDLLKSRPYDMVLMDIQMPEMDGYTATRYIRQELKQSIPIIAMTAHAFAGEREKCLSQGMNEYLSKPINEQELYGLINRFAGMNKAWQPYEPVAAEVVTNHAFEVIDLTYMREISRGNKVYEKKVTQQFIDAIPRDMGHLEQAMEQLDIARLQQQAHHLKTTVSIMGLSARLDPWLETLEHATVIDGNTAILIGQIKDTTYQAMEEARRFMQE